MANIQDELSQFKIMMLRAMPFYGDVLTRLSIIECSRIPTAATDGFRIMYNEQFMRSLSTAERNYVFMHEVMHVLLMHARRSKNRRSDIWNIAADIVVNNILNDNLKATMDRQGIPFKAPPSGVYATVYRGLSVERIYDEILEDNKKKTGKSYKLKKMYGGFGKVPTYDASYEEDLMPSLTKETIGDCPPGGSALAGKYDNPDELMDDEKIKELLGEMLRDSFGKMSQRGTAGSYFVPDMKDLTPKGRALDWKTVLKNFVTRVQSDDSSYATPERKYLHMDMILPGHAEDEDAIEEVWAFIDTSGSISYEELQKFLRQLYAILKDCKCILNIAYWDTGVTDVYKGIKNSRELEHALPKHSGGTDINCVYKWMKENKIKPDIMIVMTDGYYGVLLEEYRSYKLRKKTIQVLNTDYESDALKHVGKITRLKR